MSGHLPNYEVFAIRYATRAANRSDHFIGGDPHDGPMPMDYFVWVVRNADRVFVVDTGFTAETAVKRKRDYLRCPIDTLPMLGIRPEQVEQVILSHMHYDHAGSFHKFPKARFHLQDREMAYATGRYMRYHQFAHSYNVEDVVGLVRLNYEGRIDFLNGDAEIAPGVSLHRTGGHADGLQVIRVHTARGWMVLAADATHFYENMQTNRPFPTVFHVDEAIESYRILERLSESPDHIIPGHDPQVMRLYPAMDQASDGVIVRLDVAPRAGN